MKPILYTFIAITAILPLHAFGSNYAVQHTIKCQNAFIGFEYNESLAHTCHLKWKRWTREILSQLP